jgi:NhaA family Na+:H+ antiporter
MTIPAYSHINREEFLSRSRYLLREFEEGVILDGTVLTNEQQREAAQELEKASELVQTPLQRLEHYLHPWVIFGVMPVFALANAGVSLGGNLSQIFINPVTLGIALGLIIGKQIGITLFSWIAVRSGLATLSKGVSWLQIYGAGWLGGIGFTMSIFIAGLAFSDSPQMLSIAKIGILTASLIAGIVGFAILRGSTSVNETRI